MDPTPNLGLPRLDLNQENAEFVVNDALNRIDAYAQPLVESVTNTPPGSPAEGDKYIVGTTPSGGSAFDGHASEVAIYFNGWIFVAPKEGWIFWVKNVNRFARYDATQWVQFLKAPTFSTGNRPVAGILTGAHIFDTTLGIPIWYDGANWVDATGATV